MSQGIDLCEDSDDDNREWPNTATAPPLLLSRKRPRDKEISSNDDHLRDKIGPGNKTSTGPADFVVDLEFADEVEVSPLDIKRRGVVNGERNANNDSEDAHVADHRESHEGIAPAASHPMNSDSEQTNRDVSSTNMRSQKLSISKPPSNASGRQRKVSAWEARLSELAEYRRIHGHCIVPQRCSEYSKLSNWVTYQRRQYKVHLEGKKSKMTNFRIQELERLGFGWGVSVTAWEDRLSELADYSIMEGNCNVPQNYSDNTKLAYWVGTQRREYRLHQEGKKSSMTTFRIQELESIGFEWDSHGAAWEDHFNDLADYRISQGHCNVPQHCNESAKLAAWVVSQRCQYRLHFKEKRSSMTTFRIQELESLGFEWDNQCATWEVRLSELADYRKIHGHCNVPRIYNENIKLANWVAYQRRQYRLHLEGKRSSLTLSRIRVLENIGMHWTALAPHGKTDDCRPTDAR
jgi:hypothetical protein